MAEKIMVEILPELPAKYYAAIGEIVSRFSWIEHQLHVLIREILGLDKKRGRIMLVGMGVKPKSAIIRALTTRWVPDHRLRGDLINLAKDAINFKGVRDQYAHGLYCRIPRKRIIYLWDIWKANERIDPKARPLPLNVLRRQIADVKRLQRRAESITRRLKASHQKRARPARGSDNRKGDRSAPPSRHPSSPG